VATRLPVHRRKKGSSKDSRSRGIAPFPQSDESACRKIKVRQAVNELPRLNGRAHADPDPIIPNAICPSSSHPHPASGETGIFSVRLICTDRSASLHRVTPHASRESPRKKGSARVRFVMGFCHGERELTDTSASNSCDSFVSDRVRDNIAIQSSKRSGKFLLSADFTFTVREMERNGSACVFRGAHPRLWKRLLRLCDKRERHIAIPPEDKSCSQTRKDYHCVKGNIERHKSNDRNGT